MATRIAVQARASSRPRAGSRYARSWMAITQVAAGAWIAVAVLQTPRLPLLGLAAGLGAIGGVLFVRAPASTARARRQYVAGVTSVAGMALVTVGVGHHPVAGLTTVALLAGSSPVLIRWMAGS